MYYICLSLLLWRISF